VVGREEREWEGGSECGGKYERREREMRMMMNGMGGMGDEGGEILIWGEREREVLGKRGLLKILVGRAPDSNLGLFPFPSPQLW
jgi:hypothetical protein